MLRKVLLIFDPHVVYSTGKLQGIRAYADAVGHWELRLAYAGGNGMLDGAGDGVIGPPEMELASLADARGIPMTCPFTGAEDCDLPRAHPDHESIGRLAFSHLRDLGLVSFGEYRQYSPHTVRTQVLRAESFINAAEEDGQRCVPYTPGCRTRGRAWSIEDQLDDLSEWLRGLAKPTGVFAANDELGLQLIEAARIAGLSVPDDVAILGCINDPIVCTFSQPTLSSIEVDQYGAGYEAAALLDRMMNGQAAPAQPVMLPPKGVVARQSTDTLCIDDALVADAACYIRSNVERSLDIEQVVDFIGVSRYTLHRRFKKALGRTVRDEITRAQLTRAKQLLTSTDLPLADIAARSGYGHSSQLARDIKLATGATPMNYRRQFRR